MLRAAYAWAVPCHGHPSLCFVGARPLPALLVLLQEAEEEQLRAEQEAAQLRGELRALQSPGGAAGAGGEGGGGAAGCAQHPSKAALPGSQEV